MEKKLKVGILGTGGIAECMARTLQGLAGEASAYAVASRSKEKAEAFAKTWGFERAYGSYEELVADPEVDLVYVATPHSHHYENACLALQYKKPLLIEKAFTANAKQAKALLQKAKDLGVFVTEAIWTRYLPAREIIKELITSGEIGEVSSLKAEFSLPLTGVNRLVDPNLAGGALLDLGVYPITFASMYLGDKIEKIETTCEKYHTGVDGKDAVKITYKDGKVANLAFCLFEGPVNEGEIFGDAGKIFVQDLNNYTAIRVYDKKGVLKKECQIPAQITGYEYEVLACRKALMEGKLECEEMPHSEIILIMEQMDALREKWGVRFPFE